jgi:hypothetical protein
VTSYRPLSSLALKTVSDSFIFVKCLNLRTVHGVCCAKSLNFKRKDFPIQKGLLGCHHSKKQLSKCHYSCRLDRMINLISPCDNHRFFVARLFFILPDYMLHILQYVGGLLGFLCGNMLSKMGQSYAQDSLVWTTAF